jgi:two-component sensor histidine kinase
MIDEVSLNIDTAICCGLIINELISNALKYAFPNDMKGTIWVELHYENHCCSLLIKNNGINLQEPLDLQKLKSLGLQLVKALVEQLKGQMVIEQIQGLAFRISFQL